MEPWEFMCRRPTPVKATSTKNDFDFDEGLIDRVLGTPNKIHIPERYIPEQEPALEPEEEKKRSQKAEAICRLLSKSNGGAIPVFLPLPQQNNQQSSKNAGTHVSNGQGRLRTHSGQVANRPTLTNSIGHSLQPSPREVIMATRLRTPGGRTTNSSGFTPGRPGGASTMSLPSSPVRRGTSCSAHEALGIAKRADVERRLCGRKVPFCDWSLAGVSAPNSPYSGRGDLGAPSHSHHSSYSSTSSRSSCDREDLLHLQQNLAREVTERSRIVAVRAAAESPGPFGSSSHEIHRWRGDETPPSPVNLPTIQQREGFFT